MSHETHWDPAVRELIARAEVRGAERALQAVESWRIVLAAVPYTDAVLVGHVRAQLDSILAEHRDERPTPEPRKPDARAYLARLGVERPAPCRCRGMDEAPGCNHGGTR